MTLDFVDKRFDYRITAALCVLTFLGTLPFAVYHLLIGDGIIGAAVTAMDALVAVLALLVYRRRGLWWANYVMMLAGNALALLVIDKMGTIGAYWLYPCVLVNFYLLPLRVAAAGSAVSVAATLALLGADTPADMLVRLGVTLSLSVVFAYVFSAHVTRQQQMLSQLGSIDPLSRVGNRRAFEEALTNAINLRARYGTRASLILIDIDHFKAINDRFGHPAGDRVISALATLIGQRARRADQVFRYGGEEFVLLAPHTGLAQARSLAESLRLAVMATSFGEVRGLTISAGVAELAEGEAPEAWFERADQALYAAKHGGRNQVSVAPAL